MLLLLCLCLALAAAARQSRRLEAVPPSDDDDGDLFLQRLEQEALAVTSQHLRQRSGDDQQVLPPQLTPQEPFFHSYVSNTGSGNRKHARVANVTEEFLWPAEGVSYWDFRRFNHSDFLLATSEQDCLLWRPETTAAGRSPLHRLDAIAIITAQYERLVQCSLWLVVPDASEAEECLLLSALAGRGPDKVLHIYRVLFDHVVFVSTLPLEQNFYKLSVVDTTTGSRFVTLNRGPAGHFSHSFLKVEGPTSSASLLSLTLGNPVDLVTLTADGGQALVAVANVSCCQLLLWEEEDTLTLLERLYLPDLVSLSGFRSADGGLHLLVSGRAWQRLYRWRRHGLLLVQQMALDSLVMAYVAGGTGDCGPDRFLVAVRGPEPLRIFLWSGDSFDDQSGVTLTSVHPQPWSLASFSRQGALTLLTSQGGRGRAFSVSTSASWLPNPILDQTLDLQRLLNEVEELLQDQERRSRASWEVLGQAVLSSNGGQRSLIAAAHRLERLEVVGEVLTEALTTGAMHWRGSPLNGDDLRWTVEYLGELLHRLEQQLTALEAELAEAVLLDETVTIGGHKTVMGGVQAPAASFEVLKANQAGGRNVDQVLKDTYRMDEGVVITGQKVVKGTVHVTGTAALDRLNGIQISSDVMLTERPQHVTGHWQFVSPLTVDGDLNVVGNVNDVKIGAELFPLAETTAKRVLTAPQDFHQSVRVLDTLRTPWLDSVDVEAVALNSLSKSHAQVIGFLPPFLLGASSSSVSELNVTGRVDGVDVGRMAAVLARTDRPAQFAGAKLFLEPDFREGLVVFGSYDGVDIPFDIFEPDAAQDVSGRKHFQQVRARRVLVHGWTDGLKLETDVVTLSGNQEVFGKHFASGLLVAGDLNFGEKIDGVTVGDLSRIATTPRSGSEVNAVFFGPVIVETRLDIRLVTGIDFEALKRDLVFPEERQVIFTGRKFVSELEVPRVTLRGLVNGFNVNADFVTIATDQFINGTKTFVKTIVFGGDLQTGKVDGVDLSELFNNRVTLSRESGPLQGRVTADGVLSVPGDLTLAGKINGLDPWQDLALLGKTQRLANKEFRGGVSAGGGVVVRGDVNVGLLDGVEFDHFLSSRVTLSGDQTLDRSLAFRNVQVERLTAPLVNGLDLQALAGDLMSLTRPQVVTGRKSFTGPVFLSDSATAVSGGLNGRQLDSLSASVLRLSRLKPFLRPLTFSEPLTVEGDLTVVGLVNGVDVSALDSGALKKSSPFRLDHGRTTFRSGLEVRGHLLADTVNGLHLPTSILLRSGDQEVKGAHTLVRMSAANLRLLGPLNGLDLAQLDRDTAKVRGRGNDFAWDWTLDRDLHVLDESQVQGTVNGLQLESVYADAVFRELALPGSQVLKGVKTLSGQVTVLGEAQVEAVQGTPFQPFLQDLVFLHQDHQELGGDKTFQTALTIRGSFQAGSGIRVQGHVDSVQVHTLAQSALYLNQPQVLAGDVHLLESARVDDLSASGRINGIVLHREPLLQNTKETQTLSASASFQSLRTAASLDVLLTVNGHSLPDLVRDTLFVHGQQTVLGTKVFQNPVTIGRSHHGLVNEIDLSKEVFVLQDDLHFQDTVVFQQDLHLPGPVTVQGRVNELDIRAMSEEAFSKTQDQVVGASFTVREATSGSVLVEGHVSGVDLEMLKAEIRDFHAGQQQALGELRTVAGDAWARVDSLLDLARGSTTEVRDFLLSQVLNVSGFVLQASQDSVHLLALESDTLAQVWTWTAPDSATPLLVPHLTTSDRPAGFRFQRGHDGHMSPPSAHRWKYSSAELRLLHLLVTVELRGDVVVFTRIPQPPATPPLVDTVRQEHPGVTGVRIFTTGNDVTVLLYVAEPLLCGPGAVRVLVWRSADSQPLPIQVIPGGDAEMGVFELSGGLQYLLLASSSHLSPHGRNLQVFRRLCSGCSAQPFQPLAWLSLPGLLGLDLFSLEGRLHLAATFRTSVRLFLFRGSSFRPLFDLPVTSALNARAQLLAGEHLYLLVGQSPPHPGLVFRATWNGARLGPKIFVSWL